MHPNAFRSLVLLTIIVLILPGIPAAALAQASADSTALGAPGFSLRYVQTFGKSGQPYAGDALHLNGPHGLAIDADGSVLLAEELGSRLLKFNPAGSNLWIAGQVGSPWHHDNLLPFPKDVAVDPQGNYWVSGDHMLKQFDSAGSAIQRFPDLDPWQSGSDSTHFNTPHGIAFDSAGRMYVADSENQRVQVFTFDLAGAPVYSTTLGVSETPGSDDSHFNYPTQLVFDNAGRLYVADAFNNRIQRCTYGAGWSCGLFHGGYGSAAGQLDRPFGLGRDGSDAIYIADSANSRVKKCTTAGVCSVIIAGSSWPSDVAVDAAGSLYVSTWYDFSVRKYSAAGVFQSVFAGTSGIPYAASAGYLNAPFGVAAAPDGSLYVTEEKGFRLVKFSPAGTQQWAVGVAGVFGEDNAHLGYRDDGPVGNPAVDAAGQVYVTDRGNHRVQIFTASGAFVASLGVTRQSGTDNAHFKRPTGVAINPTNQDIVVGDSSNHRVQVFDSSRAYKTTLGVTGVPGADNSHFNSPWGVTVDQQGAIYVADTENLRVQKCIPAAGGYTCATFLGETGVYQPDFGHMNVNSVAVDGAGRVYVTDQWNPRILVYAANGAFLTVWGASAGASSGQLRDAEGVAVDTAGNVYIADQVNHRVQKLAPWVDGWRQANLNGFGHPTHTDVFALAPFQGYLYAGSDGGAAIFRMDSQGAWTQVVSNSFGDPANWVRSLYVFEGNLYAGLGAPVTAGAQIYRSGNGTTWTPVVSAGFDDAANDMVTALVEFGGQLYAGVRTDAAAGHGAGIWRSPGGDSGTWSVSASDGFDGDDFDRSISALGVYSGTLFAGTLNPTNGADVWRTTNGLDWTRTSSEGLGEGVDNEAITSFTVFQERLYLSTSNCNTGGQIWRYTGGSAWTKVVDAGMGDPNNCEFTNLTVYDGSLYAFSHNHPWNEGFTGGEVWRSGDGDHWEQVGPDGFGDSTNTRGSGNNAAAVYNDALYIGTYNPAGGEIWRLMNRIFLPIVRR